MTTVAVDCRFAALPSGLGRYTRELVSRMVQREDGLQYVLLVRSPEEAWLADVPASVRRVAAPYGHYTLAEQIRLPGVLRSLRAGGFFSTHFNVPALCPVPFVATVHDLILHRYPNAASPLKRAAYRFLMRRTVRRAAAVITVSAFVAGELTREYGADVAQRMRVVTEGADPAFHPCSAQEQAAVRARYGLDGPFFLYVGNAKQHKNVPALLEAFAQAGGGRSLALVTGGSEAQALRLPPGARLLPGIPDADLPALYSAADAFVTPSLYEGFCLPVVEAAACGCPVIASNRTAIPEVTPPGALSIEPDVPSLAAALYSPPPRTGPVPAPSWEDAAARTAAVLLEAFRR